MSIRFKWLVLTSGVVGLKTSQDGGNFNKLILNLRFMQIEGVKLQNYFFLPL